MFFEANLAGLIFISIQPVISTLGVVKYLAFKSGLMQTLIVNLSIGSIPKLTLIVN